MSKKKLIKGAIIGGAIVFLWCFVSWMLLPWHAKTFNKFSNEESVADAIKNNAPVSGIYILPNTFLYDSSTSSDEMQNSMTMMQEGPTLFASVRLEGMGQKTIRPLIVSLLIQIIGAGIITWMLLQTKGLKFKQKVLFVTLFGIAIGVLGVLPAWNWWCFSASYTLSICFDMVVGWFLAGLAIAKICRS